MALEFKVMSPILVYTLPPIYNVLKSHTWLEVSWRLMSVQQFKLNNLLLGLRSGQCLRVKYVPKVYRPYGEISLRRKDWLAKHPFGRAF